MSLKTTTFIGAHYPNTYMEQLCQSIHPELDVGPVCVNWFRQATKHCTDLMTNARVHGTYFWTTVKNFIFPERQTDLMSQKIPIRIHPHHLSMMDCQSLFMDIVNDYVLRAPRYAAESTTNAMLWQVLYSFIGILFLGSMLMGVMMVYKKHGLPTEMKPVLADIFDPQKCMAVVANRSLRMAKEEVHHLPVIPMTQPEELIAPDGSSVVVLKVKSQFELLGSVITSSLQTDGRIFRVHDQYSNAKSENKVKTIKKALEYIGDNSKKLRLLIIFNDDPGSDCSDQINSGDMSKGIKSPKSSTIAKRRKDESPLNYNKNESVKSSTERSDGKGTRRFQGSTGDSNTPRGLSLQKKSLKPISIQAGSPRNILTTSPRSAYATVSGIPRSSGRYSPIAKK